MTRQEFIELLIALLSSERFETMENAGFVSVMTTTLLTLLIYVLAPAFIARILMLKAMQIARRINDSEFSILPTTTLVLYLISFILILYAGYSLIVLFVVMLR